VPDQIPDVSNGVYLYGAGDLGALALEFCILSGINVIGILDRSQSGEMGVGESLVAILNPADILSKKLMDVPVFVTIANIPIQPIIDSLKLQGWKSVMPFYALATKSRAQHPLSNGWRIGVVSDREMNDVEEICEKWADNESLEQYNSYVSWHLDYTEITPIKTEIRYATEFAIPFIKDRMGQLVDIGSHEAQMPRRLSSMGFHFEEYILIEPDTLSFRKLQNEASHYFAHTSRLSVVNSILSEKAGQIGFAQGLGYCSQIRHDIEPNSQATTLDNLELRPDLLKIHTEGSELDIIMGGHKTILCHEPIIMFTVYHNRLGFTKSIIEPMRMFEDYVWHFRQHSFQGTGAVVYGFPQSGTFSRRIKSAKQFL
jgi:FkbM family methyltransferase